MTPRRRAALLLTAASVAALAHAVLTWSPRAVLAVWVGGTALALAGELAVVHGGLLVHHLRPQLGGVPLAVLAAWPATIYAWFRLAALVADGPAVVAVAALAATLVDAAVEPRSVAAGLWSYPDHPLSTPRYAGIPWWNAAGWIVAVGATAGLAHVAA